MANYIETGHAKIIANFEDLLSFCAAYGSKYQPTKMAITIPALNTSLSEAQANLSAVYTANTAFMNATNKRIEAFEPLKRLATRIINALAATNASDALIDDAKGINRKIQGKRAAKKATQTPNNTLPPKEISVSQQSFDHQIQHLAKLIELLLSEPSYTPNEQELQITNLNQLLTTLKEKNTNVLTAYVNVSNARITRNKSLYDPEKGLTTLAADTKKYLKSVFGADSPEYKQVAGIKFSKKINN